MVQNFIFSQGISNGAYRNSGNVRSCVFWAAICMFPLPQLSFSLALFHLRGCYLCLTHDHSLYPITALFNSNVVSNWNNADGCVTSWSALLFTCSVTSRVFNHYIPLPLPHHPYPHSDPHTWLTKTCFLS